MLVAFGSTIITDNITVILTWILVYTHVTLEIAEILLQ